MSEADGAARAEEIRRRAAGLAHDLNNVLSVIAANLQLLEEDLADEALKVRVAQAIQAALGGAELTRALAALAGAGGEKTLAA